MYKCCCHLSCSIPLLTFAARGGAKTNPDTPEHKATAAAEAAAVNTEALMISLSLSPLLEHRVGSLLSAVLHVGARDLEIPVGGASHAPACLLHLLVCAWSIKFSGRAPKRGRREKEQR